MARQQAVARALQVAYQLEEQGDEDGAKSRYEQILRTDPRHSDALKYDFEARKTTPDYFTIMERGYMQRD
jgi:hypothetical protein